MEINELFLKTLFCCSACDGEIADEEIELVKNLTESIDVFCDMDVEEKLNSYVLQINKSGKMFLKSYLNEIYDASLSDNDQIKLIEFAIKMIEADNVIQYSEVKFFKKIRNRLTVSDDLILEKFPDLENYLLPDIYDEDKDLDDIGNFSLIKLS